jgi:4-hydroxy-2-oxoheptanedioate aldolase
MDRPGGAVAGARLYSRCRGIPGGRLAAARGDSILTTRPFGKEPQVRENTVKSIWAKGGVVVNGWLSIPSSFSAEVMAHQGFDSLVVDMQHGVVDYQTAVTMLQAISTTGVIPFARVPWNDPAYIMKILDAGAYGIICPMINSRKEAEQLVRTCKYAPKGYRSFGPVRASIYGGTDYAQRANDTLVVMPMIETKEAVQNIDEILSTPGIDAIYVGPADLSLTLGCTPKLDQTEAPVVEALGKILDACKRHKVIAGLHNATSGYALKMVSQGWQFVTLASDSRFLAAKAAEEAAAVKQTVASGKLPAY